MEKTLPNSIEAEQGVLGSIILDPEAIAQVIDFLSPEDFYRDVHRSIYRAITTIYEHHGTLNFVTICDELERAGKIDDVGGASYISSLIDYEPTSSNIESYGRIVERSAIMRRLIHAAGQIAAIAYEQGDTQKAIEQSEQLIYAISKRRKSDGEQPLSDVLSGYMDDLESLHRRERSTIGIPTGFVDLDRLMGGMQRSDLIILAARPGQGKTSFALNIACNVARQGYHVAFYSMEMGRKQLAMRLISQRSGIDSQELRRGPDGRQWNDDDWNAIVDAHGNLYDLPIWIDDSPALSTMTLRSRARRLATEQSIDLIIVDYLQLMHANAENGKRFENRVQEVSEISQALKSLAKELGVPVIALSQLSRAVESRQDKRPQLSDLRDSGRH